MKASIFLMMTLMMMVTVTTTILSQTNEVYAENKAKERCSDYGEWNSGKCKIEDNEYKADYEDDVCDDPKDTKKYKNM